eukprot:gene32203-38949_t
MNPNNLVSTLDIQELALRVLQDSTNSHSQASPRTPLVKPPFQSNYIIENTFGFAGVTSYFLHLSGFANSSIAIGNHIKIRGLIPQCALELTPEQRGEYNSLRHHYP